MAEQNAPTQTVDMEIFEANEGDKVNGGLKTLFEDFLAKGGDVNGQTRLIISLVGEDVPGKDLVVVVAVIINMEDFTSEDEQVEGDEKKD